MVADLTWDAIGGQVAHVYALDRREPVSEMRTNILTSRWIIVDNRPEESIGKLNSYGWSNSCPG